MWQERRRKGHVRVAAYEHAVQAEELHFHPSSSISGCRFVWTTWVQYRRVTWPLNWLRMDVSMQCGLDRFGHFICVCACCLLCCGKISVLSALSVFECFFLLSEETRVSACHARACPCLIGAKFSCPIYCICVVPSINISKASNNRVVYAINCITKG